MGKPPWNVKWGPEATTIASSLTALAKNPVVAMQVATATAKNRPAEKSVWKPVSIRPCTAQ